MNMLRDSGKPGSGVQQYPCRENAPTGVLSLKPLILSRFKRIQKPPLQS